MTTTCIAAHPNDPPLALPGLRLCGRHHGRLARDLADIVTVICRKPDLIQPTRRGGTSMHSKPGSKSPARDELIAALDIRSRFDPELVNVAACIDSWARLVTEDRRLSHTPTDTVEAAGLLIRHTEWLAAQTFADEVAAEIHAAATQMRRLAGELPERPLGVCSSIDPRGEQDRCGGPLRWMDGTLSVQCARCHDTWSIDSLIHLGRVSPLNLWDTVPHIAELLDVPERTVRHWVTVGRVTRNSLGLVRHADVWHILVERNGPQQRQTAEGLSTT